MSDNALSSRAIFGVSNHFKCFCYSMPICRSVEIFFSLFLFPLKFPVVIDSHDMSEKLKALIKHQTQAKYNDRKFVTVSQLCVAQTLT